MKDVGADRDVGKAIILSHEIQKGVWQLDSLSDIDGCRTLIGWTIEASLGGIPRRVVRALARAFVRFGRVTFPCSTLKLTDNRDWHEFNGDYVANPKLGTTGHWADALTGLFRPAALPLLSTNREASVYALFDDPFYQWWNASQFALLSQPPESPPDLASESFSPSDLLGDQWAKTLAGFTRGGVKAILRPGVDGDVIGLLCSSPEFRDEIEAKIQMAANECGLGFRLLPEAAFAASLLTVKDDLD